MGFPITPYPKRQDIACTVNPSNIISLGATNANAYRCYNKTPYWGNVYITDDATQVTVGSPPAAPAIPFFTALGFGVPIPPNGYIDYRVQANQQMFASAWLDATTGTISIQPVSVA